MHDEAQNIQLDNVYGMLESRTRPFSLPLLNQLLDQKMQTLLSTLKTTQRDTFEVEEDTLTRLHSLKVINQGLAVLREQQSAAYNQANLALSDTQAEHERRIEEHNTEGLTGQLAELEEVLSQLRLEVEEVSAQNEATKLDSGKQTRATRFAQLDRSPLLALAA